MFFSKYSASGNDFILTHLFRYNQNSYSNLAKEICHRNLGVGADGLIILKPHLEYDFEWEFYNLDGSEANMCGNGSRAAVAYARDLGLAGDKQRFLSKAGVICASLDGNMVESELTSPKILETNIQEYGFSWWLIDTGVPHLVCEGAKLNKEDLRALRHKYNANVNIATLENNVMFARTFERGVEDETLACGTGMAAMFLYLKEQSKVGENALVYPASKEEIYLRWEKGRIFLKGKVKKICDFIY
ncbi:diaminopimelate epimerase [Helicobacter burdigaliensis]|uniref:diaminopimelate epimerase n=1 Tax=Helicobacter burdigaliensis TaxID=2315334 RepID=UPI000EF6DB04|nr:diaminopimelate epimerase [Helicobacter burdigaliensis]